MTARKTLADERRRRKLMTVLWMLAVSVAVILLIYKEMTAVLYILATLGITALLVIVAVSDLAHADKPVGPGDPPDARDAVNRK